MINVAATSVYDEDGRVVDVHYTASSMVRLIFGQGI